MRTVLRCALAICSLPLLTAMSAAEEPPVLALTWGGRGSKNGQFVSPTSIAVDVAGHVYVADLDNHRIQTFDGHGRFIRKWGSFGSGPGQFSRPRGVEVDSFGTVYVADSWNHRIQSFDSTGVFLSAWGQEGTALGQFRSPAAVAVDGDLYVYVVDEENNNVQKFDAQGRVFQRWRFGTPDGEWHPTGIAVDVFGAILISDRLICKILAFTPAGALLHDWGWEGSRTGQLKYPLGLAVDRNGDIYVADMMNERIQEFDRWTRVVTVWSIGGWGHRPYDVAVDGSGNVFVADTENHRIQKYSPRVAVDTESWGGIKSRYRRHP